MSKSRKETLVDIVASTQQHLNFTESAGRILPKSSHHVLDFDIQPLSLTSPIENFKSQLIKANVAEPVARAAVAKAAEIASTYQATYTDSCQKLVSAPRLATQLSVQDDIDNLRRTFEHIYEHKDLEEFLTKAVRAKALTDAAKAGSRPLEQGIERKPYNHSFTPYLEAYFQQNAYPSAADRKSLAAKGGMSEYQIVVWFQNHRNRAKNHSTQLNRLCPGKAVDEALIEAKVKLALRNDEADSDSDSINEHNVQDDATRGYGLSLDKLASSSTQTIPKIYEPPEVEFYVTDREAFGLRLASRAEPPVATTSPGSEQLAQLFGSIDIRSAMTSKSAPKSKSISSRSPTPKVVSRMDPLKATLRSCFSAAVTLTCPRSHPSFIPQKKERRSTSVLNGRSTILETVRVAPKPYTLPAVLPTWELPTTTEPERVVRCKKPTISSHAGKTRPGSPYPKQTISRMSSASSLASMASDDSQSSSRSTSSTFSASTVESSELDTPAQSPTPDNAELIDDVRFSEDIFGDYFFHSNPISENFFFDINVEQPFDKDVSLSIAEFDKSVSLSIAEFETTTLPSFDFFES